MTYEEVTEELIQVGITTNSEVYIYRQSTNVEKFESFFNFCQENLINTQIKLHTTPARFFFQNSFTVNGYAGVGSNYFVIKIPYGTIDILWTFFADRNSVFDDPERESFRLLEAHLDSSMVALMFQNATLFTFYHEKAHLIQKGGGIVAPNFQEQYLTNKVDIQYRLENHVYEFDADLYAAHFCVMHLLGYWDSIQQKERNADVLRLILVMGTCSIMVYFIFLFGANNRDIYYHETLHPHPVARISYIVDLMVRTMASNGVEVQQAVIIREATILAEAFYLLQGENRMLDFAGIFLRESDNVAVYINELFDASTQYSNLAHLNSVDPIQS